MRLKLTIEYAGTRYSGWQVQKNARTVQGEPASMTSNCTALAAPTRAFMPWRRSLISISDRRCLQTLCVVESTMRFRRISFSCAPTVFPIAFTPVAMPCREAICTRSRADGPHSRSPSSGG